MSGGSGTRLWPLSTDDRPKQFHALAGDRSLLQQSVDRLLATESVAVGPPILIANRRHAGLIDRQMQAIGRAAGAVVIEPFGRNTAAVGAVAALVAQVLDPEALVLLMPADHVIADPEGFSATVARAAALAETRIVTFGVEPTAPETGYGYIEVGPVIGGEVCEVTRFVEKPDLETAKAYLAGGRHLWNAGIFLFSPKVLLAEMERWAPEVVAACRAGLEAGRCDGVVVTLDEAAFAACPSISIDYAVMEQTDKAAVAPIGVSWADVGSWSELWRLGPREGQDNFLHGDAVVVDTKGSLVWSESKTVGVIGVSDLIVVQTEDAVIVLPKSRAQDVKLLVEQIKARTQAKRA